MDIRGLNEQQIRDVLAATNEKHGGNIEFVSQYTKDYRTTELRPLNKRGNRYSARLKVKSASRPGARVGVKSWSGEPGRRINAACWHVHRDFLREVFDINPDAKVISALATYNGEEDFEDKFPDTYYGSGMSGPAPIQEIGGACNCDEGDFPEYAVEGLTAEQYETRAELWRDGYLPSGAKRALNKPEAAIKTIQEVK